MLIYSLQLGNVITPTLSGENVIIQIIQIDTLAFRATQLPIDNQYMISKYGFPISKTEALLFRAHYTAWEHFLQHHEPWCLVMESTTEINVSPTNLSDVVRKLPPSWDIFFPYSPLTSAARKEFPEPYLFGTWWGSYAYFLSKSGARRLASIAEIRQPVDEEIMYLHSQREIEAMVEEMSFFSRRENESIHRERKSNIESAILSYPAWTPAEKKIGSLLLQLLAEIAFGVNIDLVLDSGTLLGHIRHGSIMNWDDDIDLAINETDLDVFLNHASGDQRLNHRQFRWEANGCIYYKFWLNDGELIARHRHRFPYVDVWVYSVGNGIVKFRDGKVFKKEIFLPFQKVMFENTPMNIPALPLECLDVQYEDWKETIQIFPYSHKREGGYFYPLSMSIKVDEKGRMIAPRKD